MHWLEIEHYNGNEIIGWRYPDIDAVSDEDLLVVQIVEAGKEFRLKPGFSIRVCPVEDQALFEKPHLSRKARTRFSLDNLLIDGEILEFDPRPYGQPRADPSRRTKFSPSRNNKGLARELQPGLETNPKIGQQLIVGNELAAPLHVTFEPQLDVFEIPGEEKLHFVDKLNKDKMKGVTISLCDDDSLTVFDMDVEVFAYRNGELVNR